ncbi:MAG: DUF3305 domain-containing protein [Boseongicola sp. SB0673_bin_14]|nr:DUF3305 domain-containing protein [Boseongicola sp. SB0667_bin_21]MYI68641.1 DUF3305 domain-containing protein [Boseongicola sp. SB0673_bin_14]
MYINPAKYEALPLGVVLRRAPGVTRWKKWSWKAVAVLPGAGTANWREMRRQGDWVEYHAATVSLDLHGAETEAYKNALSDSPPSVFVVLRPEEDSGTDRPSVLLVTASPYEAQDYADSGEEIVEKVPMPPGLVAWVRDFVEEHHVEEEFVKRKRDRKRIDLVEDGVGDVRIQQDTDVYRAPKRRLQ